MTLPGIGHGELIWVDASGPGRSPRAFTWRGRRYEVRAAQHDRRRDVPSYRATRRDRYWVNAEREHYWLRTASGMRCVLSCDLIRGLWRMVRGLT